MCIHLVNKCQKECAWRQICLHTVKTYATLIHRFRNRQISFVARDLRAMLLKLRGVVVCRLPAPQCPVIHIYKNKPPRKAIAENLGPFMPTCCFSLIFISLYIYGNCIMWHFSAAQLIVSSVSFARHVSGEHIQTYSQKTVFHKITDKL